MQQFPEDLRVVLVRLHPGRYDWRVTAGVAVALAPTALLIGGDIAAWWLLPVGSCTRSPDRCCERPRRPSP